MKKQKKTPTRQPFFARFLEGQELAKVQGSGPGDEVTLKYPSDDDDFPTS